MKYLPKSAIPAMVLRNEGFCVIRNFYLVLRDNNVELRYLQSNAHLTTDFVFKKFGKFFWGKRKDKNT